MFFFLWRRSLSFSERHWFPILQQFPLWLCSDVGALSTAVRSTCGTRNMLFNEVRAKQIALCFTSLLLMHYHCPSTMKKQKVWVSTCRHRLFGLFPCLPPPVNFTTCLHCAVLEDKFSCSLRHSWGKFVMLGYVCPFHQKPCIPQLMATGQWFSLMCSKRLPVFFFFTWAGVCLCVVCFFVCLFIFWRL